MNQFHDILLPGSCISEAQAILRQTTALLEEAGRRLDASFGRSRWAACSIRWVCADGYRYLPVNTAAMHPACARARGAARRRCDDVLAVAGLRQQPFSFTPLSLCAGADGSILALPCLRQPAGKRPLRAGARFPRRRHFLLVDRRTGRGLCAKRLLTRSFPPRCPRRVGRLGRRRGLHGKLRPDGVRCQSPDGRGRRGLWNTTACAARTVRRFRCTAGHHLPRRQSPCGIRHRTGMARKAPPL